jgi:hypothetical protein
VCFLWETEGADMTPHQKAIEAMAKTAYTRKCDAWQLPVGWDREAEWVREKFRKEATEDLAAGLASARESGSDMMPREPNEKMLQAGNWDAVQQAACTQLWRLMFNAAPRFEDAP